MLKIYEVSVCALWLHISSEPQWVCFFISTNLCFYCTLMDYYEVHTHTYSCSGCSLSALVGGLVVGVCVCVKLAKEFVSNHQFQAVRIDWFKVNMRNEPQLKSFN